VERWSQFWSENKLGDCFSLNGESDLSQVLIKYWEKYFVNNSSSRFVLDLACGNGFVGKCAINTMTKICCIGVDQASEIGKTDFNNLDTQSKLKILPGINISDTKFVDNEFDLVVSQFGLEYGSINEDSIKHIVKQIKPGGELNFIAHHPESFICKQSKIELEILKYINRDRSIFNQIRKLKYSYDNAEKESFINEILKKGKDLAGKSYISIEVIFLTIKNLISALEYGVQDAQIDELELHYIAYEERLNEQLKVALCSKKISDISLILRKEQINNIESKLLHDEKLGLIGWEVNVKV
jgi:SAM-dependent methyltransferase